MATRTRTAVLLVPALAGALALGGCSVVDNVVDGAVQGAQEQIETGIDDAIGEALGGAGISRNGELPPNFPTDVPVIDAELIGGGSAPGSGGWAVQYTLSDIGQFADAAQLLKDAGYRATSESSDATSGFGTYTNDAYTVVLTATEEPGAPTLYYVVTASGQQ